MAHGYDYCTVDHVIGELTDTLDYCADIYNRKVRQVCETAIKGTIETLNSLLRGLE